MSEMVINKIESVNQVSFSLRVVKKPESNGLRIRIVSSRSQRVRGNYKILLM